MADLDLLTEVAARMALPSPAERRAIRERAGVSQRRLARQLGISSQAVSFWEHGARMPRGALLVRYTDALASLAQAGASSG